MGSETTTALSLLAIGMITVFVVLLLVVLTGNLLIRVSNALSKSENSQDISRAKLAAITSAVEVVTQGRAKITRIERS